MESIVTAILGQLFSQPLHVPTRAVSLLWVVPICLSIALVYKAIKLDDLKWGYYLREVGLLFCTLIGFLAVAGVCLLAVLKIASG
jgi:hypothetical protein